MSERLDEEERHVRPDGLSIRRRRHDRAWSPRKLLAAIGEASFSSTGIRESITPNLLSSIEERNEAIPYATLCLVAGGLGCDPVDILGGEAGRVSRV